MCQCARDSGSLDNANAQQLAARSQDLTALFGNEVFLVIYDGDWAPLWSYGSHSNLLAEMRGQLDQIRSAISSSESVVLQLNSAWRVEELTGYRVVCQHSRLFVRLLTESCRLVIVHQWPGEGNLPEDGQDFERNLQQISVALKDSLFGAAPPHNP
jgi:hypothetical protein